MVRRIAGVVVGLAVAFLSIAVLEWLVGYVMGPPAIHQG